MKNRNLFNRKDLNSFSSSLRNRSTSAEAELGTKTYKYLTEIPTVNIIKSSNMKTEINTLGVVDSINHPGRYHPLQYFDYHCAAATPPSKGGETFSTQRIYNTTLSLTAYLGNGVKYKLIMGYHF